MKILRVSHNGVGPVIATKFIHKDKEVYNIRHGEYSKDTIAYTLGICNEDITPSFTNRRESLDGDDYDLRPVKHFNIKTGDKVKSVNSRGDNIYYLGLTDSMNSKSEALLLVEPVLNKNATVSFSGDYTLLGNGEHKHDGNIYKLPVILAKGKVYITWINGDENTSMVYSNGEIKTIEN